MLTDKYTGRQTGTDVERQSDRQIDRQPQEYSQSDRQTDRQTTTGIQPVRHKVAKQYSACNQTSRLDKTNNRPIKQQTE